MKKLFLLLLILTNFSLTKREVKMLIEITEEGATISRIVFSKLYPQKWMDGFMPGELTSTGKRQLYLLGKKIAKEYPEIFNEKLKSKNIQIRSLRTERHFSSAQVHLIGLLKRESKISFAETDQRLAPQFPITKEQMTLSTKSSIPGDMPTSLIFSDYLAEDTRLRLFSKLVCKNLKINSQDYYEEFGQKMKMKPEMERMVEKLKIDRKPKESLAECYLIAEYMISKYYSDPNSGLDPNDPDFQKISKCVGVYKFKHVEDDSQINLIASSIGLRIISYLNRRSSEIFNGQKNQVPIFIYYSSENDLLGPLLKSLGILDPECLSNQLLSKNEKIECVNFPIFASNLVIELEMDSVTENFYVNVRYDGKYYKVCSESENETKFSCELEMFTREIKKVYDPEWYETCGLDYIIIPKKSNWNMNLVFFLVGFNILMMILVIVAILAVLKKKKSSDVYLD